MTTTATASTSANNNNLDAPLIALTNQCGGDLRAVLQAFFSFLHRRTDFYLVPHADDLVAGRATMGFPQGDAEKILLSAFRQFPLRRLPKVAAAEKAAPEKTAKETLAPPPTSPLASSASIVSTTDKVPAAATHKTNKKNAGDEDSAVRLTAEGLQVPVGNGGSTVRYKWTQTLEECSVLISVPEHTRGKNLNVNIKATSLSVKLKTRDETAADPVVLVEGTLWEKVTPSESTWTIEGGVLIVVLYKHRKQFWSCILQGDDKIDTTMVDSRRNICDYDDATQAQIRKIMFDQNQAKKGQSSSDEILGKKPEIPATLPPGVEYINQDKLDKHHEQQSEKKE